MSNTSYSVELKGLDLPAGVRERIDASVRKAVLSELGKVDLAAGAIVEPLTLGRPTGPLVPQIMGFTVRKEPESLDANITDRSLAEPSYPHAPSLFGPGLTSAMLDMNALQTICLRPDIREAVILNCQAFLELLSHNPQACENFNSLTGQNEGGPHPEAERFVQTVVVPFAVGAAFGAGVVAVVGTSVVVGAGLGAAVGWASRKK